MAPQTPPAAPHRDTNNVTAQQAVSQHSNGRVSQAALYLCSAQQWLGDASPGGAMQWLGGLMQIFVVHRKCKVHLVSVFPSNGKTILNVGSIR
jgi:hypothetical protein